jgi:YidC/Oxa1 family membrane protein insertase
LAAFVPLAAGLYLLTTTGWTLAERTVLRRLAPRLDHGWRHHV